MKRCRAQALCWGPEHLNLIVSPAHPRPLPRLMGALPHTPVAASDNKVRISPFLWLCQNTWLFLPLHSKTSLPLLLLKLLSQFALSWDFTTPERERPFLYMKFKLVSSLFYCLHSDNKEYKSLWDPLLYLSQKHLGPWPSLCYHWHQSHVSWMMKTVKSSYL